MSSSPTTSPTPWPIVTTNSPTSSSLLRLRGLARGRAGPGLGPSPPSQMALVNLRRVIDRARSAGTRTVASSSRTSAPPARPVAGVAGAGPDSDGGDWLIERWEALARISR